MSYRRGPVALLALSLLLQPGTLIAQSAEQEDAPSRWRRWVGAASGAVILGGVASFTDQAGDQARTGVCDTTGCVVALGSLLGAGLGYLLGSELDKKAVRRGLEGPTVELELSSVDLADTPNSLREGQGGVYALTRDWVFFVDDALNAERILGGFPARAAAVGMDGQLLLLASSEQIVGVPIPGAVEEPLPIVSTGAASLETLGGGGLAVAQPGSIQRVDLQGSALAPSVREGSSVSTVGLAPSLRLAPGGNVLWTLEDSTLVARRPGDLSELARLGLPGRAVAINLAGPLATIALGDAGAAIVDVSDPRSLATRHVLTGMDFAYDAAALDGRVYVAAGAQGVFVYDFDGQGLPSKLGVVREPDFSGDLLVRDGRLYILDRAAGKLYRN
jgi:hypothetical protein